MNWDHRDSNTWLSAAVITTDRSRWIRRNNSGCRCLSLARCEPPSSMCSSSTQAGNFRFATPSSSLLGIVSRQHVAHSFRSCIRRASLRPPRPALKLFHQYLRLQWRSRLELECGKLHADENWKPYLQPFVRYLKVRTQIKQRRWRLQLEEF